MRIGLAKIIKICYLIKVQAVKQFLLANSNGSHMSLHRKSGEKAVKLGMSINSLKIFALICMIIDHIGEFFPQSPMWLRWIGRISAPLFFYCSSWGFHYTRSKKTYLVRLYLLGILMSIGNITIYFLCKKETLINNNIFVTLFLGCAVIFVFENKCTNKGKVKYLILFLVQQTVAFLLCALFAEFLQIPNFIDTYMLYYGYGALFGSIIFTEGSIWFVLFFVVLYLLKENKMYLSIFVLFFTGMLEVLIRRTYYMRGAMSYLIPFNRFQWLMIFAIPFFLIYNGKKGKGNKMFYYLFYPLHIWVLYAISN